MHAPLADRCIKSAACDEKPNRSAPSGPDPDPPNGLREISSDASAWTALIGSISDEERLSRGAFYRGCGFESLVIDFCGEPRLIRRKRRGQSGESNKDDEREPDGGFPLVRIAHNLEQSGACADICGPASFAGRSQDGKWNQGP